MATSLKTTLLVRAAILSALGIVALIITHLLFEPFAASQLGPSNALGAGASTTALAILGIVLLWSLGSSVTSIAGPTKRTFVAAFAVAVIGLVLSYGFRGAVPNLNTFIGFRPGLLLGQWANPLAYLAGAAVSMALGRAAVGLSREARQQPAKDGSSVVVPTALGHGAMGLALLIFTPIVASFAIAFGWRALARVVFFGSETGATSGAGPWSLYTALGIYLLVAWLAVVVITAVSGEPPAKLAMVGGALGLAFFVWQVVSLTGSLSSWMFPIVGYCLGHVADVLKAKARKGSVTR